MYFKQSGRITCIVWFVPSRGNSQPCWESSAAGHLDNEGMSHQEFKTQEEGAEGEMSCELNALLHGEGRLLCWGWSQRGFPPTVWERQQDFGLLIFFVLKTVCHLWGGLGEELFRGQNPPAEATRLGYPLTKCLRAWGESGRAFGLNLDTYSVPTTPVHQFLMDEICSASVATQGHSEAAATTEHFTGSGSRGKLITYVQSISRNLDEKGFNF